MGDARDIRSGRRSPDETGARTVEGLPADPLRGPRLYRGEAPAGGILDSQTSIAEKAFGEQYRKIALDEIDASDPLTNATLPR